MESVIKAFDELSVYELYEILKFRVDVFIVEQNCPYHEIDDVDKQSLHIYFEESGKISAYLRVVPAGVKFDEVSLGRVVTRKRGAGLGKRILEEGIKAAVERFGAKTIFLEAQEYARGFYEKSGFIQCSEEFLEDGIPHIGMRLKL